METFLGRDLAQSYDRMSLLSKTKSSLTATAAKPQTADVQISNRSAPRFRTPHRPALQHLPGDLFMAQL